MRTIAESFLVVAFTILWVLVLPIAGMVEIGIVVSDRIEGLIAPRLGIVC